MADNKLRFEQLRDVRDQLRRPLAGRPILIPLGTKAFVAGCLDPVKDPNSHELLTVDGTTLTREACLDVLQDEMDQVSNRKKKIDKPAERKALTPAQPTKSGGSASYFEIREELDDGGNEVRSEAVDVSKHLDYLRSNPENFREETLPPAEIEQDEFKEELLVQELRPVTDQQFDALSARLEELARLEEEDEAKEKKSRSSSRVKSGGWSKGFLNTNKSSKKKKAPTKRLDQVGVEEKKVLSAKPKVDQVEKATPKQSTVKPFDPSAFSGVVKERTTKSPKVQSKHIRRVGFNVDQDQVREIPRVDHTPVRSVAKSTPKQSVAKPFDPSVFSGVIKERSTMSPEVQSSPSSRVRFDANQDQVQEIPKVGHTPVSSIARPASTPIGRRSTRNRNNPQPQEKPKKKLSRFAMERQQMGL